MGCLLYAGAPAEIICFGHHHPVHYFHTAERLYLNPGSLGCCDRPVARYGILHLDAETTRAELREVPYENRAFLAAYEELQVPARAFILRVFHGGQSPA